MPLSVVDLYSRALPRTNCGDCGFPTCRAFASMVVSRKLPLAGCPHLPADTVARHQPELDAQHAAARRLGGEDVTAAAASADLALRFRPLPRVPVLLLYWEADPSSELAAAIKLAFEETIPEHLDIESILFLSEHLAAALLAP